MSKKHTTNQGIIYSTELGKMCPTCSKSINVCTCGQTQTLPAGDGIVRISRETKGRKGKGVSLVIGIPLGPKELMKLAKKLKQQCGTGGTVKNSVIEVQGDHRDKLKVILRKNGYTVKLAGG